MGDIKEIGVKTGGGIATAATTYAALFTVTDVQAYAIIFASICTGIYYLAATYKTLKNKKERKDGKDPK